MSFRVRHILSRTAARVGKPLRRVRQRIDGSDRGAVLPILALFITVLVLATSLAVDIGRLAARNQDLQKVADMVALDAVRAIGTSSSSTLVASPVFLGAVEDSAAHNGLIVSCTRSSAFEATCTHEGSQPTVTVQLGSWDAADRSFHPDTSGADVPTAVQVAAGDFVSYYFGLGFVHGQSASRSAVSNSSTSSAWFKVGSSLVALDPNSTTVIGSLLNNVIPGASALSYEGIATAPISLSLLETDLGVMLGSPTQLLSTKVSLHELVAASIEALQAGSGNTADIQALNQLLTLAPTVPAVTVGDLLGVDASGGMPAGQATIGLWQLLTTSAFLFNGNNAIDVPALDLGIPGLASVGLKLQGIQPPQIGGPDDGASVTTQQVRLVVTPQINLNTSSQVNACSLHSAGRNLLASLLGLVGGIVGCLLGPVLETVGLSLNATPTIDLDLARATVSQQINCDQKSLTLNSQLSAVQLNSEVQMTAQALGDDLLQIDLASGSYTSASDATSTFAAVGDGPNYTTFNPTSADVGSQPVGLGNVLKITDSEVKLLDADVPILGDLLTAALVPAVNAVLSSLDTALITPLANLLGLNLGGATLWPLSMNCIAGTPQLVQ